ncbi:MAG TPA: Xaa-Pro aminopeptidase [Caulobacterales bacterium]|nr:Xaa-Pro aminopeptidase [Caulobacterales bacterium]
MLNRRVLLGSLAGAGLTASAAFAQTSQTYGTPGGTAPFTPDVYRARRERLMSQMRGGVAVLYSADSIEDGAKQNPDFAYLTGIVDEAGAALVLAPEERTFRHFLFLKNRDVETERWDGERISVGSEAEARTGFDRVSRMSRLGGALTSFASRAPNLHFLGPLVGPAEDPPKALSLYGDIAARDPGVSIKNSWGLIPAMRSAKEPREIELMRRAIAATENGLKAAMRAVRPGMHEFELKDIIEAEFRRAGARGLAFPSIVGAGRDSAVLHYPLDNRIIEPGDMVLCDVGAEYQYYAADITRTFPVSGQFSDEQRQIYELVLNAQDTARRVCKAGVVYEELQLAANQVFRQAGHIDDFWHGLGHFVGLEVHDAGDYSKPLPQNAVVTIEPGCYLPARGFGVRIEDDFLVTRSGCEHMSNGTPHTVAEIESFMAGR